MCVGMTVASLGCVQLSSSIVAAVSQKACTRRPGPHSPGDRANPFCAFVDTRKHEFRALPDGGRARAGVPPVSGGRSG
jgi:hypothetical protein